LTNITIREMIRQSNIIDRILNENKVTCKCDDCKQITEVYYNKYVDMYLCSNCETEWEEKYLFTEETIYKL